MSTGPILQRQRRAPPTPPPLPVPHARIESTNLNTFPPRLTVPTELTRSPTPMIRRAQNLRASPASNEAAANNIVAKPTSVDELQKTTGVVQYTLTFRTGTKRGAGLSSRDGVAITRSMVHLDEAHYPERLGRRRPSGDWVSPFSRGSSV